jgi:hypothetical protein
VVVVSAIIPTAIAQRFHQPLATALDLPRLAGGHHTALAIDGSLPAHGATMVAHHAHCPVMIVK